MPATFVCLINRLATWSSRFWSITRSAITGPAITGPAITGPVIVGPAVTRYGTRRLPAPRFAIVAWCALLGLGWFGKATATGPLAGAFACPSQDPQHGDVVSLFDGSSLAGFAADPQYWSVQAGVIVGQIPPGQTLDHNTWLVYQDREFADFELRFQFRLSGLPAANSGIQIRSQVDSIRHVSGYQADLDLGQVWLGRIYDEHGRGLIVERGTRVWIDPQGTRHAKVMAPATSYGVLFREQEWNDYRVVAIGQRMAVWINGTLFCELWDQQEGEFDLSGFFAWQLHSGPETLLQLRQLQVEVLSSEDPRLGDWLGVTAMAEDEPAAEPATPGHWPKDDSGRVLNMGFERGTLEDWTAEGNAFRGQPVAQDGIAQRWSDQQSNKEGDYFVGGYEIVRDQGVGTLTSVGFPVTEPFASFLIGGGRDRSTRAEIQVLNDEGRFEEIFAASGQDQEAMQRVVVDLQPWQGRTIRVQLIDENRGGWGHLNFDDFRLHAELPAFQAVARSWRDTANPILQHLVPNPISLAPDGLGPDAAAAETLRQMFVPPGFSVDVVAAEPRLHQPMAFTFDGQGRIWVVEGYCYPERRPPGQGLDRILVLTDQNGDGRFETSHVFYEGLNLVSALEVGHGGVWIGAAPELLFIPDADGDARADGPPVVLLDGFGFADTHETLNNFCWGPDGWLYGNQGVFNQSYVGPPGAPAEQRTYLAAGVFRYHPRRQVFEVFAHGGSNQWGLDFDQYGQLFMTHCRSFWGGGPTTHVLLGGHYWNQVNSGYADFVSPSPIDVQPALRNYLLASARYGHGEGGAGKPGSGAVYGGHSHVGTMLYLGDNWPSEYRNRLFTHNLHGHQINQQLNLREAGGYHTVHAGQDVFFCADPQYIGVDLKYGPDGAVYFSDWYDPRHCHNPNVEQWDRGNGRLYRMQYDANYQPVKVHLTQATDQELVQLQAHTNEWHARAARLELAGRTSSRPLEPAAVRQLRAWMEEHPDPLRRLRCLWCLHGIGQADEESLASRFTDPAEEVRGWAVRLLAEGRGQGPFTEELPSDVWRRLWQLGQADSSLWVRRELAAAAQRLQPEQAWRLVELLAQQADNAEDPSLVSMIWFAIAQRMRADLGRGLRLAERTNLPVLRDSIVWYAAKISDTGRQVLLGQLAAKHGDAMYHDLRLIQFAVQDLRGISLPDTWRLISAELYGSKEARIRQAAEVIGASFRDPVLFARLWETVLADETPSRERRRALAVLEQDPAIERLPQLLELIQQPSLVAGVLPHLRKYDSPEIADVLIGLWAESDPTTRTAVLELLTSRATWAARLLDAVDAGTWDPQGITAYHVRQMVGLGNAPLQARLEQMWGAAKPTSADLQAQIRKLVQAYEGAPLWAYDSGAGQRLYQELCANCHQETPDTARIAPALEGSGSKGIHYLVENIVDPNAVVGRDFQARLILTTAGRVITGLVISESETAVTIRTANASETIARDEIEEIQISDKSFMPEGLLDSLEERQRIELFKYLLTL